MQQILNLVAFMSARINVARKDANDRGATATEYALLVSFIAIAIIGGVTLFGGALNTFFTGLGSRITK
jgi:pilus assembly protein Flp/PilA